MHLQSKIKKKKIKPLFQKQVIYLVSSCFTKRDFERYGIKNWIKSNWQVKVFDVTSFVYTEYWRYIDGDKISYNFEGLTIFQNINEVLFALNNIKKKVVFIDILKLSKAEFIIRKAASAHGVLIKLNLGLIPTYNIERNIWVLFCLIKKPIILIHKLILFIKYKTQKIRYKKYFPDYLVVGGSKSMQHINNKKTSIIKAHNFDYDFLIKKKKINSNKDINYLLFLDEYGPYHSDFILAGIKPYMTAENFYPAIDHGLNEIAKSLKLNIKIAAHPSSNYEVKNIKYKYPIFKNKTFELIRDADVIVGNISTAFQWAVIMKKPIIFVTTDEIQNESYAKYYKNHIYNFAKSLGKKVVNVNQISSDHNWEDYLNIDHVKYEKYIENYIKMKETPEKLLWNIIIEHIEKDLFI